MIKFKLTRDQARMVQEQWMPYMVLSANSNLRNNAGNDALYLNGLIIETHLKELQMMFKLKLLRAELKPGNPKISFSINLAHGATFYVYLFKHGIEVSNVYAFNFRQQLCDAMHQQLFANRPPAHQSVPLTINDFDV